MLEADDEETEDKVVEWTDEDDGVEYGVAVCCVLDGCVLDGFELVGTVLVETVWDFELVGTVLVFGAVEDEDGDEELIKSAAFSVE